MSCRLLGFRDRQPLQVVVALILNASFHPIRISNEILNQGTTFVQVEVFETLPIFHRLALDSAVRRICVDQEGFIAVMSGSEHLSTIVVGVPISASSGRRDLLEAAMLVVVIGNCLAGRGRNLTDAVFEVIIETKPVAGWTYDRK